MASRPDPTAAASRPPAPREAGTSHRPGGPRRPPARPRRPGTGRTGPIRLPTAPARKRTPDSDPRGRAWWPLPCPCPWPRAAGPAAWRRRRTAAAAPPGWRPGPVPAGSDRAPCARLPRRGSPAPDPGGAGELRAVRAPAPTVCDCRDCACRARLSFSCRECGTFRRRQAECADRRGSAEVAEILFLAARLVQLLQQVRVTGGLCPSPAPGRRDRAGVPALRRDRRSPPR